MKRNQLNADDRSRPTPRRERGRSGGRRSIVHSINLNRAALCCSGGGIRSATFCLGVIQALAKYDVKRETPKPGIIEHKHEDPQKQNLELERQTFVSATLHHTTSEIVLELQKRRPEQNHPEQIKPAEAAFPPLQKRAPAQEQPKQPERLPPIDPENSLLGHFQYLSTVSGGGYIGSWLSAWRQRESFETVIGNLTDRPRGPDVEPPEISWLRAYSNYLTAARRRRLGRHLGGPCDRCTQSDFELACHHSRGLPRAAWAEDHRNWLDMDRTRRFPMDHGMDHEIVRARLFKLVDNSSDPHSRCWHHLSDRRAGFHDRPSSGTQAGGFVGPGRDGARQVPPLSSQRYGQEMPAVPMRQRRRYMLHRWRPDLGRRLRCRGHDLFLIAVLRVAIQYELSDSRLCRFYGPQHQRRVRHFRFWGRSPDS